MNSDDDQYTNIQQYLLNKRMQAALSQEEMANQLAAFDADFSEVDAQTISRWELGKVSPSIHRQVLLMRFFHSDAHQLLTRVDFELPLLSSLKGYEKHLSAELEYKHIFAAHPYIDAEAEFKIITDVPENIGALSRQIAAYLKNITRAELIVPVDYLQGLIEHSQAARIFYIAEDLLLGHVIALRLKPEFAKKIAFNNIPDDQIPLDAFAHEAEPYVLYLYSGYSGTRDGVENMFFQLAQLAAQDVCCDKLLMKIRTDFGMKLISLFDAQRVQRGQVCEGKKQGVKDGNRRYSNITYSVAREAILANPVYLNLARNQKVCLN
ncbi:MAG: helix-turn-helix transcriptional regulator [Pseudomonadales bacterium]|nr:helix-turn-helix transcriptional regulator [Pseudomonadales bacterium]